MKLRDIMIREVQQVTPETTIGQTALRMRQCAVGAVVVTHDTVIKGILTDRDLLRCLEQSHDPYHCPVVNHMTHPVTVLRPEEDHLTAVDVMQDKRIKRLPVAQDGRLVGIVSMSDLTLIAEGELQNIWASWTLIAGLLRTQAVQVWRPKPKVASSQRADIEERDG